MAQDRYGSYATLQVSILAPHVLSVELNRPKNLNTMNLQFWSDCARVFEAVELDHEVRVVLLSGAGRMFTGGLDLTEGFPQPDDEDPARAGLFIRRMGKAWQKAFDNIEKCGKPVIACMHNACIGGGIEMVSACDIRFCTRDAFFVAAEVNVGMAADVGGLQRFPKTLGNQSLLRELVMSARKMGSEEALQHGFVSRVCEDKDAMMTSALDLAKQIAAKSPIAMLGIKELLNYSRDHTVDESLDYAITWNMGMLQGRDMKIAGVSAIMKKPAEFPNLPPRSKF